MTRAVAATYRSDNVQCNAICPGYFKSPMTAHLAPEVYGEIARRLPNNEWGSFGNLMGTAVFLASKASDYVSGTYVIVDGGFAASYL